MTALADGEGSVGKFGAAEGVRDTDNVCKRPQHIQESYGICHLEKDADVASQHGHQIFKNGTWYVTV
jgi:hypothetical protein